jgi:hypothetical protein
MFDPGIYESMDYMRLAWYGKEIFRGLIQLADDYGRGKCDPGRLIGRLFWYGPSPTEDEVLEQYALLEDSNSISFWYTDKKELLYQCNQWDFYQKPAHKTPSKIAIPRAITPVFAKSSRELREILVKSSRISREVQQPGNNCLPSDQNSPVSEAPTIATQTPDFANNSREPRETLATSVVKVKIKNPTYLTRSISIIAESNPEPPDPDELTLTFTQLFGAEIIDELARLVDRWAEVFSPDVPAFTENDVIEIGTCLKYVSPKTLLAVMEHEAHSGERPRSWRYFTKAGKTQASRFMQAAELHKKQNEERERILKDMEDRRKEKP